MFRFLHAADFHLDSSYASLTPQQAVSRRRESRELLLRLANYVGQHRIDLVLLAGDLLDGERVYRETGEALCDALAQMAVPVLIAPGNHDWYGEKSWYGRTALPSNVYVFKSSGITEVEFPQFRAVVHGAAFQSPECAQGMLKGFVAPEDGKTHLMVLHGELDVSGSPYNPITKQEVADSRLTYLALGHIHKPREPLRLGKTVVAWPGCLEGRGFDELGDRGFYEGTVDDDGAVHLKFVPFARRHYEILRVDLSERTPLAAIEAALPMETANDLYRILLTGETDDQGVDLVALQEALSSRFYALELRDETRIREDIWTRAGEDSLRGLFLRELREKRDAASTDQERKEIERAARFGLAALDHRDLG